MAFGYSIRSAEAWEESRKRPDASTEPRLEWSSRKRSHWWTDKLQSKSRTCLAEQHIPQLNVEQRHAPDRTPFSGMRAGQNSFLNGPGRAGETFTRSTVKGG